VIGAEAVQKAERQGGRNQEHRAIVSQLGLRLRSGQAFDCAQAGLRLRSGQGIRGVARPATIFNLQSAVFNHNSRTSRLWKKK
jgi:hypothetical protein